MFAIWCEIAELISHGLGNSFVCHYHIHGRNPIMMKLDLESCKESALVYEVIVEVAGEVFEMQRSMLLVNDRQIFIGYKRQLEP
ncbi:hypothetical protein F7734_21465 [Scytonema sp. UIC 10036]|uniref:hypothetical protein n=1 Tax=Scytonema sp. UIC 10036 TaxID=2304196 RepID=UPI0012DAB81F|nr:hypothetical protein [Scytonema sp. UIC 10036]MUG94797.1 hypothetical protein [Scytonema sp. UIC 10036]